jgi:hypothetical protein
LLPVRGEPNQNPERKPVSDFTLATIKNTVLCSNSVWGEAVRPNDRVHRPGRARGLWSGKAFMRPAPVQRMFGRYSRHAIVPQLRSIAARLLQWQAHVRWPPGNSSGLIP